MSIDTDEWNRISSLQGAELKAAVFHVMQVLASDIQTSEGDDPNLVSAVPRLVDLIEHQDELADFREPLTALARSVGLWNYIDPNVADVREAYVAESVRVDRLGSIVLHREQINALNALLAGRNLILSAPTSFGKSVLVDALLLTGRYNRVAVVLPTLALLDEFRRRLIQRFGDEFSIVSQYTDKPTKSKVVFLGTQERLMNRSDTKELDLVVVDEFYKLDPRRRDERCLTLNAAVYKLLRHSNQFFFLGPNIENVQFSNEGRWNFQFLKTRFSTVAVDTFNLKNVRGKKLRLSVEAMRPDNWPVLIFVSSPAKANKLASTLNEMGSISGKGEQLAEWISENFHSSWGLVDTVRSGIAVHHGRIPRALGAIFIRAFNGRKTPVLICTSTLIEGVNTAAKSVIIYDKKIAGEDYDFFTFSNIRGRAGRLGEHRVGKVFLFHDAPEQIKVEVEPPLFGDYDEAPSELAVHLSEEDRSPSTDRRISSLQDSLGLSGENLKRYSSIGVDVLQKLNLAVRQRLSTNTDLSWQGFGDYGEIGAVIEVICTVREPRRHFGAASSRQLSFFINELRKPRMIKQFYKWHGQSHLGDEDSWDNIFKFLRACEYSLPEFFGVIELFVRNNGFQADYSLIAGQLPNFFRPEVVKMLEEQGIPMQISERFYRKGDTISSLSSTLSEAARNPNSQMNAFEREWLTDALVLV